MQAEPKPRPHDQQEQQAQINIETLLFQNIRKRHMLHPMPAKHASAVALYDVRYNNGNTYGHQHDDKHASLTGYNWNFIIHYTKVFC